VDLTLTEPAPMPKRTDKPEESGKKRDEKAVKIDRKLADRAKVIADSLGITIGEYLSPLLRPHIDKDFPKAVQRLNSDED
jgi:hypothetical protein